MKEASEVVRRLDSSHLLRELAYLSTGYIFLLVINYLFKPDLDAYPNISHLNSVGKVLAVAVISYGASRICSELGRFLFSTFCFLLRNDGHEYLAGKWKKLTIIANNENVPIERDNIIDLDIDNFLDEKKSLAFDVERAVQSHIFKRASMGFCFIMVIVMLFYTNISNHIFLSMIFFILFLLIFVNYTFDQIDMFDTRLKIGRHIQRSKTS